MTEQQKTNVKKWIDALRSKKYQQCQDGYLQTINGFSALGVACHLFKKEAKIKACICKPNEGEEWEEEDFPIDYGNGVCQLPIAIQSIIGFKNCYGSVVRDKENEFYSIEHMDVHLTFDKIADFIEKQLTDNKNHLFQ